MKKLIIVAICFILILILNDLEDTLVHHYDVSIFAPLGHGSYFYPDWTRKYISGDSAQGRISIWFIPVPAMFFDAWHLFKVLREAMGGIILFIFLFIIFREELYWDERGNWTLWFWASRHPVTCFIIFMLVYGLFVWGMHELFYGQLLLR
jgi:hypothetical protein